MYGLGLSRTLTEFVEMVNKEDPVIVVGLLDAANERIKSMYGQSSDKTAKDNRSGFVRSSPRKHVYDRNVAPINQEYLIDFLKKFGATNEEVQNALNKIKKNKPNFSGLDYGTLTPEVISDPNFDIKGTLKKIRSDINNSVRIDVSLDKMFKKARERMLKRNK